MARKLLAATRKASTPSKIDQIVDEIMAGLAGEFEKLPAEAKSALKAAILDGANKGLAELKVSDQDMISAVNKTAANWADKRAAEMVGMKWDADGNLVPNPRAKWAITDDTRDQLRGIIKRAFESEGDIEDTIAEIREAGAFSEERAELIAITEVSNAQVQGNWDAWEQSGLVEELDWLLSANENVCEECEEMADGSPYSFAECPRPIRDTHPRCQCTLRARKIKGIEED